MTIFKSLGRSQSLVQKITDLNNDAKVNVLLTALTQELETLQSSIGQLQIGSDEQQTTATPQIKSGCYIFANQKGFFCPNCYDNHNIKTATKRMNSKLRVCPVCRASIR